MFDYASKVKNIVRQHGLDYITVVVEPKTSFYKTHIMLATLEPNVPGAIEVEDEVAEKCGHNFAHSLQQTLTEKRRSSLTGLQRYIVLKGDLYITGAGTDTIEISNEQQLQEALIAINERYSRIESEQESLKNKLIDGMVNSLSTLNTLATLLKQAGVGATVETEVSPEIAVRTDYSSKKYTLPTLIAVNISSAGVSSTLYSGEQAYPTSYGINYGSGRGECHTIAFTIPKNIKTLKNRVLKMCETIEKALTKADFTDYHGRWQSLYQWYSSEMVIYRTLLDNLTPNELGSVAPFLVSYAIMGRAFGYKDLLPQIEKITTELEHREAEAQREAQARGQQPRQPDNYREYGIVVPQTIMTDFGLAAYVPERGNKSNSIDLKRGDQLAYRLTDIDKEFMFSIPDIDVSQVQSYQQYIETINAAIKNELEEILNNEFVKWESFERCLLETAEKNWLYAHFADGLQALADDLGIEYTPLFQVLKSVGKVKLGQLTHNNKSVPVVFDIPEKTLLIGNDYGQTTDEVINAVKRWMSGEVASKDKRLKYRRSAPTWVQPGKEEPDFSHSRKKPFPHSAYVGKYEVPGQGAVQRGSGRPFTLYIHSDSEEFPENIFSGMNLHAKILPPLHKGFLGWIGGYINKDTSTIYITEIQSDLMQRTWDLMDEFKSKYSAKNELRDTATKLKELRRELARLHAKQWAPAAEKFALVQKIQELESGLPRTKEKITRVPRLSDFKQYKSKLENVFKKWVDVFYDNVEEYAKINNVRNIYIISTDKVFSANAPKTEDTVYYRAYDAIAKMRGATRLTQEWWKYELPLKEERIGRGTQAYIYHRVPNVAVLQSIMRSTLLPSIAGAHGPGIYTSLNKSTNTGYGPIIVTLLVNLANKFIIFQNDTLCRQIYGQNLTAVEQFKQLGIDAGTNKVAAARGYVADPSTTSVKDIKAWSEINGAVYGDVVVLYRPSVARLVSSLAPVGTGWELKSLGGKRVKAESRFTRKLTAILE